MKTTHWQSLASILLLGVFGWMAAASLGPIDFGEAQPKKEWTAEQDGYLVKYTESSTVISFTGDTITVDTQGKRDEAGRWHGEIGTRIIYGTDIENPKYWEIEHGDYVNGKRHGTFIRYFYKYKELINTIYMCFNMDELVICASKHKEETASGLSAFSLLRDRYTWFLYAFHAMAIGDELVEPYLQALESEIRSGGFEATAWNDEQLWLFEEAYGKAVDSLSNNDSYKKLVTYHNILTTEEAADIIRGNEFRLAVIDRHRSGSGRTYNTLASKYPGYTSLMVQAETEEGLFETFCGMFDQQIDGLGPLDQGDPFFVDSLDQRTLMVLFTIMFSEKSFRDLYREARDLAAAGKLYKYHQLAANFREMVRKDDIEMRAQDFGFIVFYLFMLDLQKGDMVRRAMRDIFFTDIARPPLVTTTIPDTVEGSGVIITGHVLDDGGAEVTDRGIAWGTIYNPTAANNTVSSGSDSDEFSVSLPGLSEGQTYYARAYATNSVGTAYGNVVAFSASQSTDVTAPEKQAAIISVYPIPTRNMLHVVFENSPGETSYVSLVNLHGQVVSSQETILPGRHQLSFHTEGLRPGIYFVRIDQAGKTETRKVIIE